MITISPQKIKWIQVESKDPDCKEWHGKVNEEWLFNLRHYPDASQNFRVQLLTLSRQMFYGCEYPPSVRAAKNRAKRRLKTFVNYAAKLL